jgi:outer membrane protein assembly factor BamB
LLFASSLSAAEWLSWRGPERNGISPEKGLLKEWKEAPKLLWRVDDLGSGYSSVAIKDGRIYTMGQIDGDACMLCLDLKDGKRLWATEVGSQDDPNCTPTVDGDRVYGLSKKGILICCDTKTGREIWKVKYEADFGGKMMSGWGYSESPLVDGDKLIVTPGGKDAMLAALDKKTGKLIWKTAVPDKLAGGAGYSSVVISNAAGVKQYIQLVGKGIVSVDAATGKLLWSYEQIANGTANIPTPIVKGDFVFCSTGYGTGAALLKVVKSGGELNAEEVYFLPAKDMQNHHGGMVLIGDHIYCGHGHNEGFPLCIEMKTGKAAWKPGRGVGKGSAAVLAADGHLIFRYESGDVALIEATPTEYKLKGHFKAPTHHGPNWPHPVVLDGKLYLRDQGTLLCYDIRE